MDGRNYFPRCDKMCIRDSIWDAQNAAQDPALTDAEKENLLALIREDVMNSAEVTQIGDAAGLQAMQANGRYRLSDDICLLYTSSSSSCPR